MYLFAVAALMAYFSGFFLSLAFEVPVSISENFIVSELMHRLGRPSSLRPSTTPNKQLQKTENVHLITKTETCGKDLTLELEPRVDGTKDS